VVLSFRDRFAGAGPHGSPTGQVLKSQYFNLALNLFF